MSTWIKICGLQTNEHVQVAVRAGVSAIGFVFARSVRQISPQLASELSELVPSHISTVAVFLRPDQTALDQVLDVFQPDCVQADWSAMSKLSMPDTIMRIPVCREGDDVLLSLSDYVNDDQEHMPEPFIYEGAISGQGETVNWPQAAQWANNHRLILAGGLSPDNIAAAIKTVNPFGVDVSSGVEQVRGVKDAELIKRFVSEVRNVQQPACGVDVK